MVISHDVYPIKVRLKTNEVLTTCNVNSQHSYWASAKHLWHDDNYWWPNKMWSFAMMFEFLHLNKLCGWKHELFNSEQRPLPVCIIGNEIKCNQQYLFISHLVICSLSVAGGRPAGSVQSDDPLTALSRGRLSRVTSYSQTCKYTQQRLKREQFGENGNGVACMSIV